MEPLILTDKSVFPDDALVFSIIGKNSLHWKNLMKAMRELYPAAEGVWKYYNDGKNWLFRLILKKKTVYWIGVLQNTFRITFYFGDKAEPFINNSDLPDSMKADFRAAKRYGNLRAITIKVGNAEDIEHAVLVAGIKVAMK